MTGRGCTKVEKAAGKGGGGEREEGRMGQQGGLQRPRCVVIQSSASKVGLALMSTTEE